MNAIGEFFVTPIEIGGIQKALLLLPLCLSISIVYKVTRCERLADVPAAVGALWVTIVVGMYAVGVGLWVVYLLVV
ncbi:MAG: hypothetical protein HOP29_04780 [Phycisphaerales bacterium]|nr:hypothetical protein [Phycisphaerales bacterium]